MKELDDILNGLGIASTSVVPVHQQQESTDTPVEFTDNDVCEILTENGFPVVQETFEEISDTQNEDEDNYEDEDEEVVEEAVVGTEEEGEQTNSLQEVQTEPLIPENSPTLLVDETTSRFSGTEWYNEVRSKLITFAGIGGIGSNAVFQLARLKPAQLYLYDDDVVEAGNMSGQLFGVNDIGRSKVDAIYRMVHAYTSAVSMYTYSSRFNCNSSATDIMMCGFDNMEARKTYFHAWYNRVSSRDQEFKKNCLFLDGRLSIDTLQVYCLTGDDTANIKRYMDECLFSDSEADATVCSMKQTTYLACMIGSIMTNLFTNFCANLLQPIIPYDLPFFTEYDAQNMIFKTEK